MVKIKQLVDIKFEKIPLLKIVIVCLLINVSLIIIGTLSQFILPPQIPLFFGLPQTEQQLASSIYIILPALLSLIITLFNLFLVTKLYDIYLKKMFIFTSLVLTLLSSVAIIKIIFLVGIL